MCTVCSLDEEKSCFSMSHFGMDGVIHIQDKGEDKEGPQMTMMGDGDCKSSLKSYRSALTGLDSLLCVCVVFFFFFFPFFRFVPEDYLNVRIRWKRSSE